MPLPSTARQPKPRSRNLAVRVVRCAWTAPTNGVGHAAGWILSGRAGRPVGGPLARARAYPIRAPGLGWVRAVTLGHAILHQPGFFEGRRGRLILAHELAHTRQHDVLGPLYLPLHILAQLVSALLWTVSRVPDSDAVHAHNPLEETWICLGARAYKQLARGERWRETDVDEYLRAFEV